MCYLVKVMIITYHSLLRLLLLFLFAIVDFSEHNLALFVPVAKVAIIGQFEAFPLGIFVHSFNDPFSEHDWLGELLLLWRQQI